MEESKFILEVQSRPCLWNPGVEEYWDRVLKREIWAEVAAKMYKHYDSFSDDEKQEAVIELQKNWKSLTDFYKRRNLKLDVDEKTQRVKPIIELLHFLDNVTNYKREKRPRRRAAKKTIKIKNKNVLFQIPKHKKTFKPETSGEFQQTDHDKSENDANLDFLQSLLPDMQSLDTRQRFEFKLEVMKLIKKIKYDREVPNISINTDLSQQDSLFCDQPATFVIQTPTVDHSPRSLSPLNFSLTPHDEQLMIGDIENELQLISSADLDLSQDVMVISGDPEIGSLVTFDRH